MRVAAFNPEVTSTQRATFQDPDPATWRMLELEMPKASGGVLDITMLRPLEWLDAHNIVVGGSVALNMPELGAQGNARVLGVYPCPEIKPGPGQVITATFAHPATFQVLDVTIGEGADAETIGVTETHPFWSVKHDAFVPVGQLTVGDELLTLHGQKKRLTALLPRPGPPERVYNLEVHGEHTYFVGHQQLLVHNNGCDDLALGLRVNDNGSEVLSRWKGTARSSDEWVDAGLAESGPFVRRFYQATYRTTQRGGKINFHLDDLDIDRALGVNRFSDPFDVGVTNWELQQILNNKLLYSNTDFYLGLQKLSLEDILEFGLAFRGK